MAMVVSIIGCVLAFLSLLNDRDFWPFSHDWVVIAMGAALLVVAVVALVVLARRSTSTASVVLWAVVAIVCASLVSGLVTRSVVTRARPVDDARGISVVTSAGGVVQGDFFDVRVLGAPTSGSDEKVLVVVGISVDGRDPALYYLQNPTCAPADAGDGLLCRDIHISGDDYVQWTVVVFTARGDQLRDINRRFDDGEAYETEKRANPDTQGVDRRNMKERPDGVDELGSTTVVHRKNA
ncbi:MAG: hypothetical protein ABWY11_22075 [Umezawaea sp.]